MSGYTPLDASWPVIPPQSLCQLASHPTHGRALIASTDIPRGSVILIDQSVVHASYSENSKACCKECVKYSKVIDQLSEVEKIDDFDRARCLVHCCLEYNRAIKTNKAIVKPAAKPSNKSNKQSNNPTVDEAALNNASPLFFTLSNLAPSHLDTCTQAVEFIYSYPAFKTSGLFTMPQSLAARTLAVLNNNSHEYRLSHREDEGGSALYPLVALIQHSCVPNVSINATPTTASVRAQRNIGKGELLTIDYEDTNGYQPSEVRQEKLQHVHEFTCTCERCSGQQPDSCRAFLCRDPSNNQSSCPGFILATALDSQAPWKCTTCSRIVDNTEREVLMQQEKRMGEILARLIDEEGEDDEDGDAEMGDESDEDDSLDDETDGMEDANDNAGTKTSSDADFSSFPPLRPDCEIDEGLALLQRLSAYRPAKPTDTPSLSHRIAPFHFHLFHAFEQVLRSVAAVPDYQADAYALAQYLMQCLSHVLPADSESWLTYVDLAAQACVVCGKFDEAHSLYQRAAQLSLDLLGEDSYDARLYRQLSEKSPRSVQQLEKVMKNFK